MNSAYSEIERHTDFIRAYSKSPAIEAALDDILLKCRAYMEPDQNSEGHAIGLSKSRAKMFDLLLARRGQVVSRHALLDSCCHQADDEPEIKIIDVHMTHIRQKIRGTQYEIETIWGAGYRMVQAKPIAMAA